MDLLGALFVRRRVPPKSLGGREEVSLSPHAVIAPRNAAFGYQAGVDRSEQSCSSPPGLSIFAARLIRSYMGYVPEMPSIQLSSCKEGLREDRSLHCVGVEKGRLSPLLQNFFDFF